MAGKEREGGEGEELNGEEEEGEDGGVVEGLGDYRNLV